jgi:hypothetical protein
MTRRVPCPPRASWKTTLPVSMTGSPAWRSREYLHGLLPRERNKTLTGRAGTEPLRGAQPSPAQRLQWFLSEVAWDAGALDERRRELLVGDPATRPHDGGVLIINETGDRKDGTQTAHVAPQYLGPVGKIANGIVSVTSLWADEDVYYPLHVLPYTPAVQTALWDGVIPYVLGLRAHRGSWVPADDPHTPEDAARLVPWEAPAPRAADLRLVGMAWNQALRLVAVTTDRRGSPPFTPATLAEVARFYGLRAWVEQGYKQMKQELGWADWPARSDRAIRRHWALVCTAFRC